MSNCHELLDCIKYIYQAIDDHRQWLALLEKLSGYVKNGKGTLSIRLNDSSEVDYLDTLFTKTYGFSSEYLEKYLELFAEGPLVKTVWTKIESKSNFGELCIFSDHLPLDKLKRTKLYKQWLSPQELSAGVSLQIFRNEHIRIVISIIHDEKSDSSELNKLYSDLRILFPHLAQAMSLSLILLGVTDKSSFKGRSDYLIERYKLTKRELEVATALVRLSTVKKVGEFLFISENTVKFHIKSIKNKMGVRTSNEMFLRLLSVIDSGDNHLENG